MIKNISGVIPKFKVLIREIAIRCVFGYQRVAPTAIRKLCRFEPSCSNYTILAIKKYGLRTGCCKGIDRLYRCRQPNGGIDFP